MGVSQVAADRYRCALPADLTSYVGRKHETAEAHRLLGSGRLVTLAGPGGVGKTRLAGRIVAEVQHLYRDGTAFIELAELRDARLLPNLIADKLGLRDQSARPAVETVVHHLADRQILLVLDNCEHLVAGCSDLVATLLSACSELAILVTSRQSLGIAGERLLPVPPLAVPPSEDIRSVDELAHYDSVQLFIDRAKAVLPSFTLDKDNFADVATLCQGLEGLPLAIELAAVRVRSLSLAQMNERLTQRLSVLTGGKRDASDRQRTLRATIDWSYSLCTADEQLIWQRTSLFSGTFTLDAAEYVCSESGVDAAQVLDLVDGLLDKSVLIREERGNVARYRMLETLREYGQEQLGDDARRVARRHRDWYDRLTVAFDEHWLCADQVAWVDRMREDHANLRVALEFCDTDPVEAAIGLDMATRLDDYWGILGFHTEARIWLDRALAIVSPDAPQRVAALRMSGWFALLQGEVEIGVGRLDEAAQMLEMHPDPVQAAYLSHAWAMAALFSGDLDHAVELFAAVLPVFREHGVARGEMFTCFIYGYTLGLRRGIAEGRAMLEEGLRLSDACGEVFWRAWSLWALSQIEVLHGDVRSAETAAKRSLAANRDLGNRLCEAFTIESLAWVSVDENGHIRAAMLFGIADVIWREIGSSPDHYAEFGAPRRRYLELNREALGATSFDKAFADGRSLPTDVGIDYALADALAEPPEVDPFALLTRRETEVAQLVADGLTNRDIAGRLTISLRTVETHVEHILAKLAFSTRTQIAAWVARQPAPTRGPN